MNVVVVEDDGELSAFIRRGLEDLGHSVRAITGGHEALEVLSAKAFDAAILDRMLPGLDGLSVLKQARERGCQTPILMLSALASIDDRVDGLSAGADDYLIKPFAFAELAARVEALGRRPQSTVLQNRLTVGDIEMNLKRRTVMRAGKAIELQPREFSLLEQLMRSPDRIVTRAILLDRVWNFGFDPQTNIVETHLSRLRTKLNQGFGEDAIRTVRGSGYIMRHAGD